MLKRILVTAGRTNVRIDAVRAITNIFQGVTGYQIAAHCARAGMDVTLLTSQRIEGALPPLRVRRFDLFEELEQGLADEVRTGDYDAIIHSAAVSDYRPVLITDDPSDEYELKRDSKIASDYDELWIKLERTPKLIDQIRGLGFLGVLVKFKLQVDMSDEELLAIARESRRHSDADIIVANCLEWYRDRAYIIGHDDQEQSIARLDLPQHLLEEVQRHHESLTRNHR